MGSPFGRVGARCTLNGRFHVVRGTVGCAAADRPSGRLEDGMRIRDGGIVSERCLRFAVRVKPGARRAGVGGRWDGTAGAALLVAVAAPAVEGRANEAVRRAVAEAFGVRPRDVKMVSGERSRDKLLELDPAPAGARARLSALLGQPQRR